jgi:phosphoesterase RecJ-like protein
MKLTLNETAEWLLKHDDYLLLTHLRPDGDTLCSAAALAHALQKAGKHAWILDNPGMTERYRMYVGAYTAPAAFSPQHIVTVDTASETLFPVCAEAYRGKVELSIDHHGSNTAYAKQVCLLPDKAACGEIILELLELLRVPLDDEMAQLLYVAISTDTGCFAYGNTTADTLYAAAKLVSAGADNRRINKEFFRTKGKSRIAVEGAALSGLTFYRDGTIAVIQLTLDMIAKAGATEDDLENIASLPAEIEGVAAGVTVRELGPGHSKISLRTTDEVNASAICAHFGGGGHAQAAGCSIDAAPAEAAKLFVDALEANWA